MYRDSRFQPDTFLARQENILKLSISAARTLYSFGLTMFFILCISITCGQILPHARGRILHIHWADIALWTGRNLHPVRDLQKDAVRLIPSLTDAGDQPCIFQFAQGSFYRSFAPIQVIRHLLDCVDDIHIDTHPDFCESIVRFSRRAYSSLALMDCSLTTINCGKGMNGGSEVSTLI